MSDLAMASPEENLGPVLLGLAWAFGAVATLVLALRFYVRTVILKGIRIDDWAILFAYALAIGNNVFCTIAVSFGLGKHGELLTQEQNMFALKYIYLCQFFAIMSPSIGRLSYAVLLLEIIPPSKVYRRLLLSVIAVQLVINLVTLVISFAQCQPIQEFWEKPPNAHCWSRQVELGSAYFQGVFSSCLDLFLAVFPSFLFWKLNMKTSTKVSLCIIMGLGIIATVFSVVSIVQLPQLINEDPTFSMCVLAIWWTIGVYSVLLSASIPTLRPLASYRRLRAENGASLRKLKVQVHPLAKFPNANDKGHYEASNESRQTVSV